MVNREITQYDNRYPGQIRTVRKIYIFIAALEARIESQTLETLGTPKQAIGSYHLHMLPRRIGDTPKRISGEPE